MKAIAGKPISTAFAQVRSIELVSRVSQLNWECTWLSGGSIATILSSAENGWVNTLLTPAFDSLVDLVGDGGW